MIWLAFVVGVGVGWLMAIAAVLILANTYSRATEPMEDVWP